MAVGWTCQKPEVRSGRGADISEHEGLQRCWQASRPLRIVTLAVEDDDLAEAIPASHRVEGGFHVVEADAV